MIKQNNLNKVHIVLFVYWFVLLVWQNVRSAGNRGAVDTLIKAGLIMLMVVYFCFNTQRLKLYPLICTLLLGLCALVTLFSSNGISFSSILYYLYPVFLYFIVYSVGWNAQINKKQLLSLLHWVIIVVSYIVIYAVVFCRDQFASAFTISSAYGNELCSFLMSNLEYGMYLSFGIMSIFICMELSEFIPSWRKTLYIIALLVFALNLVLTFSRTSIIAFGVMLIAYMIYFAKKSLRVKLLLFLSALVLAICIIPQLSGFVTNIVFKEGTDSGRDELAQIGIKMFKEATLFHKIFGNADFNTILESYSDHGNLHNGYIQMLTTNGIKGVFFLVCVLITTLRDNNIDDCSKTERKLCKTFNGFAVASGVYMLTATTTLFYSSIDSYFLTLFAIIIPKFVRTAIKNGTFE